MDLSIATDSESPVISGERGHILFQRTVLFAIAILMAIGKAFGLYPSGLYTLWIPVFLLIGHSMFVLLWNRVSLYIDRDLLVLVVIIYLTYLWRLCTCFWSYDSSLSLLEGNKTLILMAFVVCLYLFLSNIDNRQLMRFIAIFITAMLLITLVAYLYQLLTQGGISSYGSKAFKRYLWLYRLSNTAGTVVLLFGLWNWLLVFSSERYRKLGIFNVFLVLFLLFGIASRSALGGYLVSMSIVGFYYIYLNRGRMLFVYSFNIMSAALAVYSVYHVFESDTIESLSTANGRLVLWMDAIDILKSGYWLNGMGFGTSRFALFSGSNYEVSALHNSYLQSLVEGGMPEFILQVVLIGWLFRRGLVDLGAYGIVLVSFAVAISLRNLAETNGAIFGLLNNFWVFFSWYILITILVCMNKRTAAEGIKPDEAGA